ncbi:DNA-packaging protein [Pseudomonas alkylphenolica]|jgi:phage terminase Nu1 subunit (DNA packaging protein)|uniref:DNA-packaging protein n=1 Tax=Pseudomonas alkylphenolica TaxID=237609 RepID=A0A6I6HCQ9_9PSED|nr:terminase small subunit [Pseudomonas alkylphenolica]QGW77765.1 DNA-packaging protein [Pseudomonas alkylphenolica]
MANQTITREPYWLNKTRMAASLGISVQAFDKWGVQPVARIGKEAFYDTKCVLANRLQHQSGKQQPDLDGVDPLIEYKIAVERLRLTKEQADSQARKNKVGEKELVPVGFMVFALADLSAQLASALDTTPKSVKRKHPDIAPRHMEAFEHEIAVTRNAAVDLADRIPRLLDEYLTTLDESAG